MKWTEPEEEKDIPKMIGVFNIPLSIMERAPKRKHKERNRGLEQHNEP